MRPTSIKRFEIFYLLAFAVSVLNIFVGWNGAIDRMRETSPGTEVYGPAILVGGLAISAIITFLLWYFTARKASNVARWIVVIFFLFSLVSTLISLSHGTFATGISGILSIVSLVLEAGAVAMLFQADARVWFAGASDPEATADTFE
ncbi:hypothetical protein KY084_03610 [Stakelama sp. CBK3Z-3]|uniref:Uncharacterized protein n=1 Tax=Stakelama flava TaxID=2860338 RepID=A0ABS6XIF0_9SPHN|nr:hypothetical protein [Stakelama flava]MBW4329960.1 hypothetical protein [Stakelama flava]